MIPIKKGSWMIQRVSVNAESVSSDHGFRELVVSEKEVRIEPAGICFSVNQATSKSAVLESRSQVFFADFFENGEQLRMTMSRPMLAETILLEASYNNVPALS